MRYKNKEINEYLKIRNNLNTEFSDYLLEKNKDTLEEVLYSNKSALEKLIDISFIEYYSESEEEEIVGIPLDEFYNKDNYLEDKINNLADISVKNNHYELAKKTYKKMKNQYGMEDIFKNYIKEYIKGERDIEECFKITDEINDIQKQKKEYEFNYFKGLAFLGDQGFEKIEEIIEENKDLPLKNKIKQIKKYHKLAIISEYESEKIDELKELKNTYRKKRIKNKIERVKEFFKDIGTKSWK